MPGGWRIFLAANCGLRFLIKNPVLIKKRVFHCEFADFRATKQNPIGFKDRIAHLNGLCLDHEKKWAKSAKMLI
jgi:hypothetical protein